MSKWKAGEITEIKIEPDEDDLAVETGDSTTDQNAEVSPGIT